MFKVGGKVTCVVDYYGVFDKGGVYLIKKQVNPHTDYFTLVNKHGEDCNMFMRPDFEPYVEAPTARATDPATSKGKRKVNKYEQAVLGILKGLYQGQGYTGKQIASLTGHPLNCITPRFAPLRRKGLIAPLYSNGYGHPVVKRDKQIVWVLA